MPQLFLKRGRKSISREPKNGIPIRRKAISVKQFSQLKGRKTKNDRAQIKKCKFVRGVKNSRKTKLT